MTQRLAVTGGLLSLIALTTVVLVVGSASSDPAHWPQWRGPFFNGVAKGAPPLSRQRCLILAASLTHSSDVVHPPVAEAGIEQSRLFAAHFHKE